MENVIFKPANRSEIAILTAFMRKLFEFDRKPFDEQAARKALEQVFSGELPARVWLIVSGEEAIGYVVLTFGCSLEYRGRDAILDELYIREEMRGRGIGRQALEFVEQVCRLEGIEALHLVVDRENRHAQILYRNFGFEEHDSYFMTKWISR